MDRPNNNTEESQLQPCIVVVSRKLKEKACKSKNSWSYTRSENLQNNEMAWDNFGEVADDHLGLTVLLNHQCAVVRTRGMINV